MNKNLLFASLLCLSLPAFAGGEPVDETIGAEPCGVACTPGTIIGGAGGGVGGGKPGGGSPGAGTPVNNAPDIKAQDKTKKNKTEIAKAKQQKGFFEKALHQASDFFGTFAQLFDNTVRYRGIDIEDGSGFKCSERDLGVNTDIEPGVCGQIYKNKQRVQAPNGTFEDQMYLKFTIIDFCYITQTCPETAFEFTVKDPAELQSIMNEILAG